MIRIKFKKGKLFFAFWIAYFVLICLFFYFDSIDRYRNSEKAEVVVEDLLIGRGRRGGEYFYPQFRLTYNDTTYYFAGAETIFFRNYDIGDKATAIFPKGKPEDAEYYSFLYYWVSIPKLLLSLFIAGTLFVFLFIVPIFLRWYREFRTKYRKK